MITDPMELSLRQRADRYERAVDDRIEERFKAMDKYRTGIIDRTDVMLQIFEQRLDQQRREIHDIREALAARNDTVKNSARPDDSSGSETQPVPGAPDVTTPNGKQSPADQILSFHIMHYLCLLAWRRVVTAVETAPSISTSEPQLLQVDEALL